MGHGTAQIEPDSLSFDSFNISNVFENGEILVASQGKEFDADLQDMDPKERLHIQKKKLKERLGLGAQFIDVDFFDEQDTQITVPVKVKQEPVEAESDPFAGLSAREKNMLKRKARMASKSKASKYKNKLTKGAMLTLHRLRLTKKERPKVKMITEIKSSSSITISLSLVYILLATNGHSRGFVSNSV